MLVDSDFELIVELARCTLAKKPGANNWLEEEGVGGLPDYICRIARAVLRSGDHTISQAIAIAVGRAKTWARGGGGVTAATSAKAAKAVAEWESKKVKAKANNKKMMKASNSDEITLFFANSFNIDDIRRQYKTNYSNGPGKPYVWVREVWSNFLIVSREDTEGNVTKTVKVPFTVDKTGLATFGQEKEVKQVYAELSSPELTTSLTDAQLEKAALVPCTQKDRGNLASMVAKASKLKMMDPELITFSADKPNLAALLSR